MSLLEDWDAGTSHQDPAQGFTIVDDGLTGTSDPVPASPLADQSVFGLQVLERQLSRCKSYMLSERECVSFQKP